MNANHHVIRATVIGDVTAERRRQIEAEGWTPEHDDEHSHGEIAVAAACYADPSPARFSDPRIITPVRWEQGISDWDWNPKDRRRNLVRAGALIIAEIERLDRAASADTHPKGGDVKQAPSLMGSAVPSETSADAQEQPLEPKD